jgi:16S rRNA (adenine1518-N6/adenine1519-N6)-dimethyltransferase
VPSTVKNHQPRKRFGQHFLTDSAVIDGIVRCIDPRPGEPLVEIGPGLAALTDPLLARCGRLTVIELDRDLAARLRRRPELDVIESDVLQVDFRALAGRLGAKLRVVGNLPYNISSPILFHLLARWRPSRTSTSCCRRRWWTAWRQLPAAGTTVGCR